MPILKLGDDEYAYEIGQFTNKDAIALEKATGMTWVEWVNTDFSSQVGNTALVWLVLRHNGQPDLEYDDVEYSLEDFGIGFTEAEQARIAEHAATLEAAANPTQPTPSGGPSSAVRPRRPRSGSGPATASAKSKPATGSKRPRNSASSPGTSTG